MCGVSLVEPSAGDAKHPVLGKGVVWFTTSVEYMQEDDSIIDWRVSTCTPILIITIHQVHKLCACALRKDK